MAFELVHTGIDESGALTAATPWFTLAAVVTPDPESVDALVSRAALRAGKRLKRARKPASELKWRNASQRVRADVLTHLAAANVQCFTLAVDKQGRRIEDSPENYALLASALLALCWERYPNQNIALDRHFTAPAQIAYVNTFIYRRWPPAGLLNLMHVDSQRNALVQLADFVAGATYAWHFQQDTLLDLLSNRLVKMSVIPWPALKAQWLATGQ